MTNSERKFIAAATFLLGMVVVSTLHAEVSVLVDSGADFHNLNLTARKTPGGTEYWSRTSNLPDNQLLNPDGDQNRDGPPVTAITSRNVGEMTTPLNDMAYVVWPRKTGEDGSTLVFAYFISRSWSAVSPVTGSSDDTDSRDPSLCERTGRLYLAWWNDEEIAKVYYSRYDGNVWSPPRFVSDPRIPSKYPRISVNCRNEIVVSYISYEGNRTTTNSLILEDCDP